MNTNPFALALFALPLLACGVDGAAADVGSTDDALSVCNQQTSLSAPIPTCTASSPCRTPTGEVTEPFDAPRCSTASTSTRARFVDVAEPSPEGRTNCVYAPPPAGPKKPLVVFLHGALGSADDVYDATSLRVKAASTDPADALSPDTTGFALVAIQGRNLAWPTMTPSGRHHDYYYRDLASPSGNPDIRNVDHVIDTLVARGGIDPNRIYVMGWSNGGYFGQLYAIARHDTPTPGGNRVAAGAFYTGADPFESPSAVRPLCRKRDLPASDVGIMMVHRSCDALIPCDGAQEQKFHTPPGNVSAWLARARSASSGLGDPNVAELLLDDAGNEVSACDAQCTFARGSLNHVRWPDGIADKSGRDHERAMLAFLREHPLR